MRLGGMGGFAGFQMANIPCGTLRGHQGQTRRQTSISTNGLDLGFEFYKIKTKRGMIESASAFHVRNAPVLESTEETAPTCHSFDHAS